MYRKDIVYNRDTRDYGMYLDGELIGFARTHYEAEITLDQLVFELLSGNYSCKALPEILIIESVGVVTKLGEAVELLV